MRKTTRKKEEAEKRRIDEDITDGGGFFFFIINCLLKAFSKAYRGNNTGQVGFYWVGRQMMESHQHANNAVECMAFTMSGIGFFVLLLLLHKFPRMTGTNG